MMSQTRRFLLLFTIAIVVVWVALAIAAYDRLPETIATHFGSGGLPDGFSKRSIVSWFALTAIGVGTTTMVLGIAHFTHTNPSMYNIPGKEKLLALPKDAQAPLLEQLAMWMTFMALSMVILFTALQYDMWRVAMTSQKGLSAVSWAALGLSLVSYLILMPIWIFRFESKIDAARSANDQSPKPSR